MPLTQAFMDGVAQTVRHALGTGAEEGAGRFETVTYVHRATLSETPMEYPDLQGLVTRYSEKVLTAQLALTPETTRVQRDDRQLRLATADVTWTPTMAGSVTRADGSTWRVMDLAGGTGTPFWRMRIRKIGT